MEFSRQYLTRLAQESNFIKDTLEKVLRLSEILKFLNCDVVFKDKLALKGGTAINLTAVELPRLSVDIDLDFTVNVSKDELPEIKEKFKKRLPDYMWQEGYSLADSRDHFALTSFLFNYINNAGNRDNIKVEINFLDRCHVLPLEKKKILTKGIVEGFEVLTLNTIELYASKINALLSRATPRDLYDVNAMIENNVITDTELLRKCLVFYNAIGGDYDISPLMVEKDLSDIEIKELSLSDATDKEGAIALDIVSSSLKKLAKLNTGYKCVLEECEMCKYFTAKENNKNYLEIHHLIPREFANDFDAPIEILDNYIALCPNCHRKIHLAVDTERKHMINTLFNQRKDKLSEHGLSVDIKTLYNYYKIDDKNYLGE